MSGIQKVAILKSRLYKGGVAQVLGHMIVVLNSRGIVPDILTLRSDLTEKDFESLYQLKVKFTIKLIGPDLKLPYEWHFLYFNMLSRGYASKYDLFINSNNTSFLASRKITTITYIHFPRKYRVESESASIHFPEKKDKSWKTISMDPFYVCKWLYKCNKGYGKNEILVANSAFTREAILSSYANIATPIIVLYPPVENSDPTQIIKKMQVVSLGRISDEKRQLEQIEIAANIPDLHFFIMGFTNYDAYFKKCEQRIIELNAQNITLFVNKSRNEINEKLNESAIFLHSVRNEPFGIGIVQAATHGCFPVIHGSGGAVEIIRDTNLQYQSMDEAISIIEKIKKGEVNFTFRNIYEPSEFRQNFEKILSTIQ